MRSTTLRFAALVFSLQLVGGAATLFIVRALTRAEIVSDAEDYAEGLRDDLLEIRRREGADALKQAVAQRSDLARRPRSVMLLVDARGDYLAGNLAHWPPTLAADDTERTMELYLIGRESAEHIRVLGVPVSGGGRLLTGHVIESELHVAGAMENAMLTGLAIAAALASLAAWVAAAMIERRLRATIDTANVVATGALDERVPVERDGDAFDDLGIAVNAMLDRIAALMAELKIATDGLAHDLRSPLSRLRASVERALAETRDDAVGAHLARALDEGDRLLLLLDTTLRITRAEAGLGREAFVDTDIGRMLDDIAEMYGPLAEDRGMIVRADLPAPLTAPVHRELLGQAIANLVDNALKYGGGEIVLTARWADHHIVIETGDRGPGIPEARRREALKRFGRLDSARSEQGAGLGLSLAAAVARLHCGTLELVDNDPGLLVRMTLAVIAKD